jgi:hypothetical protein
MNDYARTSGDERFGKGNTSDDPSHHARDARDKRAELGKLVLSGATIRIDTALFCDYCVLEHESAVGD